MAKTATNEKNTQDRQTLEFVPVTEFTQRGLWDIAYESTFDPELQVHMGVDSKRWNPPPSKREFLSNLNSLYGNGQFNGWGILKAGVYIGHTNLLKMNPDWEWEVGTVLIKPEYWGNGTGVRATRHSVGWVFSNTDANWVVAFAQGMLTDTSNYLKRAGFISFNYGNPYMCIMHRDTFNRKWLKRGKRSELPTRAKSKQKLKRP